MTAIERAFRRDDDSDDNSTIKRLRCCPLKRKRNKLGLYVYLALFGACYTVSLAFQVGPTYYILAILRILLVSVLTDFSWNTLMMVCLYWWYIRGACGFGPGLPIGFVFNYNADSVLRKRNPSTTEKGGVERGPPPPFGIYTLRPKDQMSSEMKKEGRGRDIGCK